MISDQQTIFYLVRHGETEFNVKRIVQGHVDSALTELGVKQAEELRDHLSSIHFDKVFSSDLVRAKRTAEILNLERQLAHETAEALRERSFGDFDGTAIDKFEELIKEHVEGYLKLSKEEQFKQPFYPGVESDEKMIGRFTTFLRELAVGYSGKTLLVVTHGSLLKSFLEHLGFNNGHLEHSAVKNGAYIKLLCDGVEFEIAETYRVDTPIQNN